jgi:hypothetical protein
VWAATSNNSDFLRSEGLKQTISDPIHRQEIVAAGIGPFLLNRMHDFFFFVVPISSETPTQNIVNLLPEYPTMQAIFLKHYQSMNKVEFL